MRDLFESLDRWRARGSQVACATTVATWGSAPRPAGARMLVTEDGRMAGSVSGGCVEAAVVEAAMDVLTSGQPRREDFHVADGDALAVGLSCGGRLSVWIEPWPAGHPWEAVLRSASTRARSSPLPSRAVWMDDGRDRWLEAGSPPKDATSEVDKALLALGPGSARLASFDGVDVFLERPAPPRRLVLVGAVHIAQVLVELGHAAGFETVVIDPRTAFANGERFSRADRLLTDWPDAALEELGLDASTFVVSLSHDPKFDLPTLQTALACDHVAYVGALGSRRTHAKRCEALRQSGVSDAALERIHAPVGLDLGGRRPEEIAVAILAEIVAVANRAAQSRPQAAPLP